MPGVGFLSQPPQPQGRLGRRSVILAVLAFVIAAASLGLFVVLPKDAGEWMQNLITGLFMAGFLTVAPLLHVIGIVCGLLAIIRADDRRGLGIVGFLLNALLLAAGILFVWAATASMGAFT